MELSSEEGKIRELTEKELARSYHQVPDKSF